MNYNLKKVKIFVTVPKENLDDVRTAMCNAGAGVIGNYTFCSTSTKSVGTFIPNDNANPYIGEQNKLEFVEEEKLEVICDVENVKNVIQELRKKHPYEEPAIDIVPLMDESDFESQMPIVVASNEKGCLGAAVLSYPDFFEKAEEVMGGSFWLLPSSIHEVLMVPDTGDDGMAEMLLEMVTMVNASGAVAPQDVLTDNAYYFDSERKTLVTAESYAAEHDDSNEDEQLY